MDDINMMLKEFVSKIKPISDKEAEFIEKAELKKSISDKLNKLELKSKLDYYVNEAFDVTKYDNTVINEIYNYLANIDKLINPKGYLFWGMSGVGKSVLLGHLAVNIIKKYNIEMFWIDCVKFDLKIRDLSTSFGSLNKFLSKYIYIKYLFLDDITNNNISLKGLNAFGILIHLRDDRLNSTTFMTANGDINNIAAKFGVPTASRINGMCKSVEIIGDIDLRKEKKECLK